MYKLGHTISYKDAWSLDVNLAAQILVEAKCVGLVVPRNTIPRQCGGGLIQACAVNTDYVEDTLDGKGTIHAASVIMCKQR